MLKRVLAGFVVSLALAGGAVAGPFEDANAAYERGDYATALRLIRPLAEQGVAQAQFNLGFMYSDGRGVPQDDTEAADWYRRAAEPRSPIFLSPAAAWDAKMEGQRP